MKTYAVDFTPRADRQLKNLYRYIADQSGEARADAYVGEVVAACRSLATFPMRGTKRDDIRANLRTVGFGHRVNIAFSINETLESVTIQGVFYGGRDFEGLLRNTQSDS